MIQSDSAHAQLFDGPGLRFRLERPSLPGRLRPGEVIVAVRLAAICGSDLHTIDGTRAAPTPLVLGHEAVGLVVGVGSGREDLSAGDRVTWSIAASCGRCAACREQDLPQKCRHLFKYGHAAADDAGELNGGYASHMLLRPGTHVVHLPETLPDRVVVAANCALATAVNATEELPKPCRIALVQGAGLLGVYTCALLREKGGGTVYVSDLDTTRLQMIERFGGIPIDADAVPRELDGAVDAAFEVAGHPGLVPAGITALRAGGQYALVGMVHPHSALQITGEAIIRKCLTLRGVHNYVPRHLDTAIAFLESTAGRYPYAELVGDPIPLAELDRAVELARSRAHHRVTVVPEAP